MSNARTSEAIDQHIRGDTAARHGIVSARVSDLADMLETTPEAFLKALKTAGIEPMVDTAEDKGRSREASERPTDPELRSLAFPIRDLREVTAVLGAEEALQNGTETKVVA